MSHYEDYFDDVLEAYDDFDDDEMYENVETYMSSEEYQIASEEIEAKLMEALEGLPIEDAEIFGWVRKAAGSVLPAVGSVVGTAVGGPAGTAIGGKIGRSLGRAIRKSRRRRRRRTRVHRCRCYDPARRRHVMRNVRF